MSGHVSHSSETSVGSTDHDTWSTLQGTQLGMKYYYGMKYYHVRRIRGYGRFQT